MIGLSCIKQRTTRLFIVAEIYVDKDGKVSYAKYINGFDSEMPLEWEVLSMFFSIHNIEPNWLDCNGTWGWYDDELGGWTGCVGKV